MIITLHDHRVIACFLHECFAKHRSILLEVVLGVPQHWSLWLAFTSSYHFHSVDKYDDDLLP